MSLLSALALAAAFSAGQGVPQEVPQTVPSQAPGQPGDDVAVLDDIVVVGRQLDVYVREFVNEVAAPARQRGLARWRDNLCVGVVNLNPATGQIIADRVSEVALDVGLTPGMPGCSPNIVVIAAADGRSVAEDLVRTQTQAFRLGTTKTDMGSAALHAFQTEERPVRWWMTSMPTDSNTGTRAIRLPGQIDPATGQPTPPVIKVFAASRLNSQVRDDVIRAVVIIDMDKAAGSTINQLADYVAMVSLAQIDPEADARAYPTILNLFSDVDAPSGMTDWDMTYLRALYATHPPRVNPGSQVTAVTNGVIEARRIAARLD